MAKKKKKAPTCASFTFVGADVDVITTALDGQVHLCELMSKDESLAPFPRQQALYLFYQSRSLLLRMTAKKKRLLNLVSKKGLSDG